MADIVSLKGNKYGLSVCVSENASFEEIKKETAVCFKNASGMFKNEKIAIAFEGRVLSDDEKDELIGIIKDNCSLDIVCIMDFNRKTEEIFKNAILNAKRTQDVSSQNISAPDISITDISTPDVKREDFREKEEKIKALSEEVPEDVNLSLPYDFDISKIARFYKGNVRSGMVINEESSLVIIGDINPGGEIYSGGNIIIFGSLKGKAFAGVNGNRNAFVFALNMEPIQIQIADLLGCARDKKGIKSHVSEHEPKIAMIKGNSIAIELVSKKVLNDITL